jgi:spore coat polysaccharide biosynthesis protein SpsF (cytidylyltransferase family)
MTTAIIVQARMKSTRLPGKVMMDLAGKTVLEHVLTRLQTVRGADVICCAVPDASSSDPVATEAERIGVLVFRGSEEDVLDRYYQAAKMCGADRIVRVTSDCPVIDPFVCGEVIKLLKMSGADYACNNMPPSWPHGLDCEAITFKWLERSACEAIKKFEREHVTQYVRNHSDAKIANLSGPGKDVVHHRWTIDTPEDYAFFKMLWPRLPEGSASMDYRNILKIVEDDPTLAAINAGQDRFEGLKKSMAEN